MKPTQSTWAAGAFVLLLIGLFSFQFSGNREETPRLVHARPADAPAVPASSLQPAATSSVVPTSNPNITAKNRLNAKPHRTGTAAESEFSRFDQWVDKYRGVVPADRAALEAEGVELARERRAALRDLIQTDPARALERAVSFGIRQDLPATVGELLEERVTGRGSLDVFAALPAPGQRDKVTPTFRKATIDGRTYDAFVYGRRLGEPTRERVTLNGIAVDSRLALNESPLRMLDARETARRLPALSDAVCAVSGNPAEINGTPVAADVGGETFVLCGPSHALRLSEQLINAEVAANAGGAEGGLPQPNVRTEGTKRLILIRVDFSDLAGTPLSDSAGDTLIGGLNTFYMESSYGRSGFAASGNGSSVTPTLRMPQTASYYGNNDAYIQLRTDARNAAVTAGYPMGNYDYDLICFGSVPGWYWAGLGYVGASGAWLRNYFTVGVAGHELGHNFGLNHANFWDTGEQSVIGGDGSSEEYGDSFDTMGSGNPNAAQFNSSYKSYMNWLHAEETTNVTVSGTYRVYAHDDTNSTGLRGLRIARSSSTNYWVEFRQRYTGNKWLMSGAGIRWAGNGNEKSHLLDTTPGSPDGRNDSALVLGRTFSDSAAGIHITTLRKAGTTPESLDIAVNLGTFPGNANPVVAVTPGATTAAIGATVTFSAAASDNDGDSLAYYWDFGDGTFGTNGTVAGKSWSSTGEYVVRCVASDMKGGQGSDSVVVTVGTPSTFQIAGRVTAYGSPLEGVRVSVSTMRVTYSDSDGYYTLAGISPGSYTVSAVTDGYDFTPLGFSNPVTVGPSRTGINFDGELTNGGGGGGTATLTSPGNNASYTAPASIVLSATATASSLQILTNVSFFQGSTKLGEDASSPYTYAWNNVPAGNYVLTARGTDTAGLISTSAPISVVVLASAPAITSQPQSQSIAAGGNVTLSVSASGSGPLSYRWRFNGSTINGATSPTLGLNNVQPLQAGAYTVVITNVAGTIISAVANLTVTCSYTLSASSTSIGASGGSRSVSVASAGGCSWTVANVPSWIVITAGNGGSGNGTVTFSVTANTNGSSRSATLIIAGRNHAVTQSALDTSRPSVAFSSPSQNSTHSNALLTITGTAEDNDTIARVDYAVNGSAFATATGTEDWSALVTLIPGTNILSIRSVDVTGNLSLTNTRSIFCVVSESLTLAINGEGTVSGATNGQALPIGRVCKLTAVPTTGFVFSNWTGGVSGNAPSLSFMMQSNMAVVANFVVNPFVATKGVYNGLFYETNEVRIGSSGAFTFALADKGTYSASLRLGKKTHKTSGRIQLNGKATNTIARPGTNSLTIIWNVNLEGAEQISGTVSDGDWTAELLGDRAVFTKTNPAPHAGKYTLVLFGSPGALLAPEGDSYGTASVDSNGVVKLKGYLADKTSIATKVPTSRNGQWPLYVPLYSGQGAILGWAGFTNTPSADLEAILNWSKPSLPSAKYHPDGFTAQAALLGSRYTLPVGPGPTNTILALTDALLILEGGNLPSALTNDVILGSGSRVTNASPVDLKMSFTLSSGLFKGGFTPPGATRPLPFAGAVLQKANYASGYFLSTNKSGRVSLEAAP